MANATAAKPKTKGQGLPINIYVPHDHLWLKTEVEAAATEENRSVSEIGVIAFKEYLDRRKKSK
jgi:hypothetical protein